MEWYCSLRQLEHDTEFDGLTSLQKKDKLDALAAAKPKKGGQQSTTSILDMSDREAISEL